MSYVNGASNIAIAILFPTVGAITLSLRYYARFKIGQGLGVDDICSTIALVFTIGVSIVLIIGSIDHEFGYHISLAIGKAKFLERVALYEKLGVAFRLNQYLALGFTKLSVLFFYRRIFIGRIFNILSWSMISVTILWTVAWFFLTLFECGVHFDYLWGYTTLYSPQCLKANIHVLVNSATDVLLDIPILILPAPFIWSLHMSVKQKLSVSAVFLLAAFSVAAACVRLAFIVEADILNNIEALHVSRYDVIGMASQTTFWGYIEVGVGMVVSGLITLRALRNTPILGLPRAASASVTSFVLKMRSIGKGAATAQRAGSGESEEYIVKPMEDMDYPGSTPYRELDFDVEAATKAHKGNG